VTAATKRLTKPKAAPEHIFRLFISGLTPRSQGAIDHLTEYCKRHLTGCYRIDVIDLYQLYRPALWA
jgi:circadian clock protein KaiB